MMMMKPLVESPECSYHCPALSSSSSERQNLINRPRQELLQLRSFFHKDLLHLPPLLLQCETLLKRMSRVISLIILLLKLNIPDYFSIIKHPMDLGTVALPLPTSLLMWKTIDKNKSSRGTLLSQPADNKLPDPLIKKRKMNHDTFAQQVLADEDRVKLGRDLDDEIEIDINDLSHDALFQLRDLLDEFLQETQSKYSNGGEPCDELEGVKWRTRMLTLFITSNLNPASLLSGHTRMRQWGTPLNKKRDPEKMRREREEVELQKKKEKARFQAEAKEAGKKLEEKLRRELQLKHQVRQRGNWNLKEKQPAKLCLSNPLEQLGLFIKYEDEDEEETDTLVALPDLILAQMKKWRKVKSIDSVVVS
ncbi:hypothetical protein DY000_02051674 [Brassica cretica]|uniref:Bromo domain-containing protein n=1 Tax=Brassica cretica TaxID=69181 RepID=A0ABQ7F5E8_BRACR|nr:hypothetical protein DY000_02051674 [Brassica cretica]